MRPRLARVLPIAGWLPHYERAWLPGDVIAGATVWAVLIPQSIAYASVAGVPAQYGLYTALGAAVMFAVFTATRQVVAGPCATVAAVIAPICGLVAAVGSPHYLSAVVALCVAAAVVYVVLGVFRMGWVSDFLASPVLEGFVFAFGFGLIADQLYKILGVPSTEGTYFVKLVDTLRELPQTDPYTFAVGAVAIALLLVMHIFTPRLPRALIVVALGIVAVPLLDLTAHGVAVVGTLPSGLPSLTLPTGLTLSDWGTLAVGALAVVLVGFSESIAAATEMAARHDLEVSTDQELVALGAAQLGSGVLGGFPVGGCLSKTAVADGAGQKTQMAALVMAGLTALTLLFLTGLFADLPKAVLGAIVIDAALSLIHLGVVARLRRVSKRGFVVFVATGLGLFFIGVVAGVIIGIVISLGIVISTASRTPVRRMAFDAADGAYVDADTHPEAKEHEGVLVLALHGPLFFADAATVKTRILRAALESSASAVVVDLGMTPDIDLDGADALTKVTNELASRGVRLLLARVDDKGMRLLRRAGTLDAIGEESVFVTVRAAVEAGRTA